MSIDLSALSWLELMRLYNQIGWEMFFRTVLPFNIALLAIYGILWLNDKKMC